MEGHIAARLPSILFCLAILLVGARGLVPSGYMIDRSAETGMLVLRLCGGMTEHSGHGSPDTIPHAGHDMHAGHHMPAPAGAAGNTAHGSHDMPSSPAEPEHTDIGAMCPYALSAVFDVPTADAAVITGLFGPPLMGAEPFQTPVRLHRSRPPMPPRGPPFSI